MFWSILHFDNGDDSRLAEVVRLLCAQKPELMSTLDDHNDTILHRVVNERYDDGTFFSEELMAAVWQLSPPDAVRAINQNNQTPWQIALWQDNQFAMELMQWKLSLDEIAECEEEYLHRCSSFFDHLCEFIEAAFAKDVARVVWEYLIERPPNRANKRMREEEDD